MLEYGSIVVDISQADGDSGGGGVAATEAQHVLHLHHHEVLLPGLTVHVGPGCYDNPCGWRRDGEDVYKRDADFDKAA